MAAREQPQQSETSAAATPGDETPELRELRRRVRGVAAFHDHSLLSQPLSLITSSLAPLDRSAARKARVKNVVGALCALAAFGFLAYRALDVLNFWPDDAKPMPAAMRAPIASPVDQIRERLSKETDPKKRERMEAKLRDFQKN